MGVEIVFSDVHFCFSTLDDKVLGLIVNHGIDDITIDMSNFSGILKVQKVSCADEVLKNGSSTDELAASLQTVTDSELLGNDVIHEKSLEEDKKKEKRIAYPPKTSVNIARGEDETNHTVLIQSSTDRSQRSQTRLPQQPGPERSHDDEYQGGHRIGKRGEVQNERKNLSRRPKRQSEGLPTLQMSVRSLQRSTEASNQIDKQPSSSLPKVNDPLLQKNNHIEKKASPSSMPGPAMYPAVQRTIGYPYVAQKRPPNDSIVNKGNLSEKVAPPPVIAGPAMYPAVQRTIGYPFVAQKRLSPGNIMILLRELKAKLDEGDIKGCADIYRTKASNGLFEHSELQKYDLAFSTALQSGNNFFSLKTGLNCLADNFWKYNMLNDKMSYLKEDSMYVSVKRSIGYPIEDSMYSSVNEAIGYPRIPEASMYPMVHRLIGYPLAAEKRMSKEMIMAGIVEMRSKLDEGDIPGCRKIYKTIAPNGLFDHGELQKYDMALSSALVEDYSLYSVKMGLDALSENFKNSLAQQPTDSHKLHDKGQPLLANFDSIKTHLSVGDIKTSQRNYVNIPREYFALDDAEIRKYEKAFSEALSAGTDKFSINMAFDSLVTGLKNKSKSNTDKAMSCESGAKVQPPAQTAAATAETIISKPGPAMHPAVQRTIGYPFVAQKRLSPGNIMILLRELKAKLDEGDIKGCADIYRTKASNGLFEHSELQKYDLAFSTALQSGNNFFSLKTGLNCLADNFWKYNMLNDKMSYLKEDSMYVSVKRSIGYPIEDSMYSSVNEAIGYPRIPEASMYPMVQRLIGYPLTKEIGAMPDVSTPVISKQEIALDSKSLRHERFEGTISYAIETVSEPSIEILLDDESTGPTEKVIDTNDYNTRDDSVELLLVSAKVGATEQEVDGDVQISGDSDHQAAYISPKGKVPSAQYPSVMKLIGYPVEESNHKALPDVEHNQLNRGRYVPLKEVKTENAMGSAVEGAIGYSTTFTEKALYPSVQRNVGYPMEKALYSGVERAIGYFVEESAYPSVLRCIGYPIEKTVYDGVERTIGYPTKCAGEARYPSVQRNVRYPDEKALYSGVERMIGYPVEQSAYDSVQSKIGYPVQGEVKYVGDALYPSVQRNIGYPVDKAVYEEVEREAGYPFEKSAYYSMQSNIGYPVQGNPDGSNASRNVRSDDQVARPVEMISDAEKAGSHSKQFPQVEEHTSEETPPGQSTSTNEVKRQVDTLTEQIRRKKAALATPDKASTERSTTVGEPSTNKKDVAEETVPENRSEGEGESESESEGVSGKIDVFSRVKTVSNKIAAKKEKGNKNSGGLNGGKKIRKDSILNKLSNGGGVKAKLAFFQNNKN